MKCDKSDLTTRVQPEGWDRRDFLRVSAAGAAALWFPWKLGAAEDTPATIVLVRGGTPDERLKAAFQALKVHTKFTFASKNVVVKPNIGWDRTPAQAANTDPDLIVSCVQQLTQAGAKVALFDMTCNAAQRCYRRSGIEEAATKAGARVSFVHEKRFDEVKLPEGKRLKSWAIYRDYLEADLRINVPILKHHTLAGISMGLKNLMGVMAESRPTLHNSFDEKLIDVSARILPELTILDARRVLRRNGPQGGNVEDVEEMNCLIAGFDPVNVDAEGARLFGRDPQDLPYLKEAASRGLGTLEHLESFREIQLS